MCWVEKKEMKIGSFFCNREVKCGRNNVGVGPSCEMGRKGVKAYSVIVVPPQDDPLKMIQIIFFFER